MSANASGTTAHLDTQVPPIGAWPGALLPAGHLNERTESLDYDRSSTPFFYILTGPI